MEPPRRSQRTNKGTPPAHLSNYNQDSSSSTEDEEHLNSTIMQNNDNLEPFASILAGISAQLAELTNNAKADNEARVRMEKRLAELEKSQPKPGNSSDGSVPPSEVNSVPPIEVNTNPPSQNGNINDLSVHDGSSPANSGPLFGKRSLIGLPLFSGRAEEWPVFAASYRHSTVLYNYSAIENNFRLQKCLVGEAREEAQDLLIYPECSDNIVAALEDRFGRPEQLVRSQISKARELIPVSEHNMELIVPFSVKVKNLVAFLDQPKTKNHLVNPTLLEELLFKLPISKREEWVKFKTNLDDPTLKDFSVWLRDAARVVSQITIPDSQVATSSGRQQPHTNSRQQYSNGRRDKKTNPVLLANESNKFESTGAGNMCICCSSAVHKLGECNEFTLKSIPSRWDLAKSKRLCFTCLQCGHIGPKCWKKKKCGVNGCERFHHPLLHNEQTTTIGSKSSTTSQNEIEEANVNKQVFNCRISSDEQKLLFRIVPVQLHGNNCVVSTYALLDEGSSVTLLDDDLARELNLNGPSKTLNLQWFGERSSTEKSQNVCLQISGPSTIKYKLSNVRTVRNLNLPVQSICISDLHSRHSNLKGLPIAEQDHVSPKILIGLDHCHLGVSMNEVVCESGPIAALTKLGWIVYGPLYMSGTGSIVLHVSEVENDYDDLQKQVADFFTTENFGVRKPERMLESEADLRARQLLASTTVRRGDRFETGLLWAHDVIRMPDSRPAAVRRLEGVERKMRRDAEYAKAYINIIDDYVLKGYARKLNEEEINQVNERTWYLPHFGVFNPNKPDKKMRLVFDAAASVEGVSLNSCLLQGPDLNQPLAAVLFQFRLGSVGVCADIEEMFHQVLIRPSDQNSQRFLWRHGDSNQLIETYVMTVMTFGAACSPCSAQFVKNFNAESVGCEDAQAIGLIKRNHYVDDMVASFESESDAIQITRSVINIHQKGGFKLRGFVSNKPEVLRAIAIEGEVRTLKDDSVDLQMEPSKSGKILGLFWDTNNDTFSFRLNFARVDPAVIQRQRKPTKRETLSIAMSVFDPFGMLANYTIYAKVQLQELWRIGLGWDEPVPDDAYEKWTLWMDGLKDCERSTVPRCYSSFIRISSDVQLHVFADASETAFASVAYWRVKQTNCNYDVAFVCGKARCAPRKLLSIPRLELQAAVMASRLYSAIKSAHDMVHISGVTFWTDSKTVHQWIQSDHRRFKPFVAHRVAEILEATEASNWKWLPTKMNVADDATRTKYPPEYEVNGRWLSGPEFLKCGSTTEFQNPTTFLDDDVTEELRPRFAVNLIREGKALISIDITRFSNYQRLLRTMAWVMRFGYLIMVRTRPSTKYQGDLNVYELDAAEKHLCRIAQSEEFPDEIEALRKKKAIPASSALFTLNPFMDEDHVIRMAGRTDAAQYMDANARRPILLPKTHPLTDLIVRFYHQQSRHQLQEAIIYAIRQKFWIPHVSVIVKRIKSGCQLCRIRSAIAIPPLMGQLPNDRLQPFVRPFTFTGLDYFGPVQVAIGRRLEKRWVALFTCMTIRAIHLELAVDLSTDACIICIRNFVNIRGVPKRIRSDNGTNFVGASKELRNQVDLFDQDQIMRELSKRGIEWVFNSPSHAEAGGCWERMVQSVKKILLVSLRETSPQVETLRSLLLEAANIINSRPLTHIPVDPNDEEPLTPNHFLLGTANSTHTPGEPNNDREMCLRKQWRITRQLKDRFWKRWILEFLPELTRRTKWHKDVPPLQKDALVLVCDTNLPRSQWRRGRVQDVFPGPDGIVRNATVLTSNGILRRPTSRLAVLNVSGESPVSNSQGVEC